MIMKEESKNKINLVSEGLVAGSSLAALAVPAFASVPLIVFAVNRTIGFISDDYIIKRLKKIEKELKRKGITKSNFKEKISNLSEHKKFFASSTLEYIIKNCIPETVDIYMSLFIDYIMEEKYDLEEELCEILASLNKHDFELLKYIKTFLKNGDKYYYHEEVEKKQLEREKVEKEKEACQSAENNKDEFIKINFQDRSVLINEDKTIFWNDFSAFCKLPKNISLNNTMLFASYTNKDKLKYSNWNFYGKAFIKLEMYGILRLDYYNYLGTINNMEISRFHLTILGSELLKYIKI